MQCHAPAWTLWKSRSNSQPVPCVPLVQGCQALFLRGMRAGMSDIYDVLELFGILAGVSDVCNTPHASRPIWPSCRPLPKHCADEAQLLSLYPLQCPLSSTQLRKTQQPLPLRKCGTHRAAVKPQIKGETVSGSCKMMHRKWCYPRKEHHKT